MFRMTDLPPQLDLVGELATASDANLANSTNELSRTAVAPARQSCLVTARGANHADLVGEPARTAVDPES